MHKRTINLFFAGLLLFVGIAFITEAQSARVDESVEMGAVASSEVSAEKPAAEKKEGNRVARFFTSSFRAVGRLFNRDKGNGKMRRLSEKDIKKFSSTGLVRVDEVRTTTAETLSADATTMERLEKGRAHLESGRLNDAIAELSRAAALDPKHTLALNLLGVAYDRKGLRTLAKESYERALKVDDKNAQVLNNLGYSLYLNGDYQAAHKRLKRAAELAPSDQRVFNNLGVVQSRLGKYDDAYKSFVRATSEFTARVNIAGILERAGKVEDALKHYEAARHLQPSSPVVLQRLAQLYQKAGRTADAELARQALGGSQGKAASAKGN